MQELQRYGMLHDSCLVGINFSTSGGVLKLLFENIYLINDIEQEDYFPNGRVEVSFWGAKERDADLINVLIGASVGAISEGNGLIELETSFGTVKFLAHKMTVSEEIR